MRHEYLVIGGGIVGLAAARQIQRVRLGAGVVVIEKGLALAQQQTGHNSGVIHAGVYYKPGSLKAELCKAGARETKDFCERHGIPHETRGKLIVATDAVELARMADLKANALANEIELEEIDAAELRRREPNIVGAGALLVHATGIVDYSRICSAMAAEICAAGGEIVLGAEVTAINETSGEVRIVAGAREFTADRLVACAGVQSDRLALLAGLPIDHRIVPFRGEYYDVAVGPENRVTHLIYPVPDPALPFLGIHLTPMIDGGLTVGPNAVLGLSRENSRRFSVRPADVRDMLRFPGFWRMAGRNWRSGLSEFSNSALKERYLAACRKYCPGLRLEDLTERPAGIRAQAVLRDGTLVHDFLMTQTPRSLHVGNAPSPAATSAIPIARMIVQRLLGQNG